MSDLRQHQGPLLCAGASALTGDLCSRNLDYKRFLAQRCILMLIWVDLDTFCMQIISLRQLSINPLSKDLRMIQGTPAATGASGVTGVQQVPLNSAGQPCPRSAGAPAPVGGPKSASFSTLSHANIKCKLI